MGAIRERIKKFKPNTITIVDLILVGVLFLVMKTYFIKEKPIKKKIKNEKIEILVSLNKYEYTKDEFLVINISLRNTNKRKIEIPIKKESLFNYEISKGNKLLHKKDYLEKSRNKQRKLVIPPKTSIVLSSQWFWEELEAGIYNISLYSDDFSFNTNLKFRLLGDEKDD